MSFKDLEGQLAHWVERLQQYDFEVVYRKGVLHRNADRLSRRPCVEIDCRYCAKVELKDASNGESAIARIVFSGEDFDNWRKEQLEDPNVAVILLAKKTGVRPSWQEVAARVLQRRCTGLIGILSKLKTVFFIKDGRHPI